MTTITYKQSPPRRAVLDDLGGGNYEDDPEFPPDPGDPAADAANQSDELVVAAHAVIEHTKLYITIVSGTPTKSGLWSVRDDLAFSDFTVTDNGVGDTSITHTGGKLPGAVWPAEVYTTGNTGGTVADVESITNGWRVRCRTASTLVLADTPFVLKIGGL